MPDIESWLGPGTYPKFEGLREVNACDVQRLALLSALILYRATAWHGEKTNIERRS